MQELNHTFRSSRTPVAESINEGKCLEPSELVTHKKALKA